MKRYTNNKQPITGFSFDDNNVCFCFEAIIMCLTLVKTTVTYLCKLFEVKSVVTSNLNTPNITSFTIGLTSGGGGVIIPPIDL